MLCRCVSCFWRFERKWCGRNVANRSPSVTALCYRRPKSSTPRLWEPHVSHIRQYGTGGAHKDSIRVNLILFWPTGIGVNWNYLAVTVSRDMAHGGKAGGCQPFGETCCMHIQPVPNWYLLCGQKILGLYHILNVSFCAVHCDTIMQHKTTKCTLFILIL